jgi:hypothetical protein
MIEKLEQVLRQSRGRWELVTDDPVLRPFLAPGGDYRVLVSYPGILDEGESNSGNLIAWRVEGDVVVLTHADTNKGPVCKIKRSILDKVVALLAETRNDPAGMTPPKPETVPVPRGTIRGTAKSIAEKSRKRSSMATILKQNRPKAKQNAKKAGQRTSNGMPAKRR